jgi:hypothetical protein
MMVPLAGGAIIIITTHGLLLNYKVKCSSRARAYRMIASPKQNR